MNLADIETLLTSARVVPIATLDDAADAEPLAEALYRGGVRVLEITLRREAGLAAIRRVRESVPDLVVAAGTVLNPGDVARSAEAGAHFAFSPGISEALLADTAIPVIPGVATSSEVMLGLNAGVNLFKFFPAREAGGPALLRSFAGPFPGARFCPTGGVSTDNLVSWINEWNVICVGGSWLAPGALLELEDWPAVEGLAREALALAGGTRGT